jgi:hypothetical protein
MLRYAFIVLVVVACGCVSTRRTKFVADDVTWNQLVETVNQLQWEEADQGAAFEKAQKMLGLENYGGTQLDGTLFIAHGKRNAANAHPWPRVWRTEAQKLLCTGDLYGDGRTEYVLGCGWFGPMGGAVCVYDDVLRKIAEVSVDDVFAIELEDLIGDGGLEILCWQDHHNGTDGWLRYLTVFRLSKSRGLTRVWEGSTYSLSNLGGIDVTKHKIKILRTLGKPAVIKTEEIYSRGVHEDTENGTSYSYLKTPYTITRYVWNPVSERFEASK